ncbi:MAG: DUF1385 domain-containing protein [Anaerolineales bacterium]|nr:DUF1385 domain-containing protein [Anaerolineales bacterium]
MKNQNEQKTERSLPNYGGQAVIEGVMMRGKKTAAIAMRSPTGEIEIHTESLNKIYQSKMMKIPFLRGVIGLWDALGLGMRALTISANAQTEEEEDLTGWQLTLTLMFSLSVAVVIFFLIPAGIGQIVEKTAGETAWIGNLAEGVIRLAFLILYMWGIGFMEEIERVFAYHGAEHKVINAFEAGENLTPDAVRSHSVEHPRCGTAFLLIVVVFSIVLFTLLGPMSLVWRFISRILLLPLIAGVSYEYLRWTANHADHPLIRILIRPNLALQNLTTREPSKEMLEVSIAAFQAMRDGERGVEPA